MKHDQTQCRQFLKLSGTALAIIPAFALSGGAAAATNVGMRTALKYQGKKECATCMHFTPGAMAKDTGCCKLMPGDTEISAQGYCTAWAKK